MEDVQREMKLRPLRSTRKSIAKNASQGSGARSTAPGYPAPTPAPFSASAERLAQLEDILDKVRKSNVPALRFRVEQMDQE